MARNILHVSPDFPIIGRVSLRRKSGLRWEAQRTSSQLSDVLFCPMRPIFCLPACSFRLFHSVFFTVFCWCSVPELCPSAIVLSSSPSIVFSNCRACNHLIRLLHIPRNNLNVFNTTSYTKWERSKPKQISNQSGWRSSAPRNDCARQKSR